MSKWRATYLGNVCHGRHLLTRVMLVAMQQITRFGWGDSRILLDFIKQHIESSFPDSYQAVEKTLLHFVPARGQHGTVVPEVQQIIGQYVDKHSEAIVRVHPLLLEQHNPGFLGPPSVRWRRN